MASFSMSKLPPTTLLAVFLLLCAAAGAVFYYYAEGPKQEAIAAKQQELSTIQVRIDKGRETARQLPDFRRRVSDLEDRLASLRPILPEEKDVADLLRRIQTLATQSNLTIRGFRPQAITTRELHAEWPIGLELEGTYHNLGTFLDRVSKFPRIINVGSLAISGHDPVGQSATIDVSCTATTFVLLADPKEGAGSKPGAAATAPAKKTE